VVAVPSAVAGVLEVSAYRPDKSFCSMVEREVAGAARNSRRSTQDSTAHLVLAYVFNQAVPMVQHHERDANLTPTRICAAGPSELIDRLALQVENAGSPFTASLTRRYR